MTKLESEKCLFHKEQGLIVINDEAASCPYCSYRIYSCKRCSKEVRWHSGLRKDMQPLGLCGWCTSYVTLWPRRIRRFFAIVLVWPFFFPFWLLSLLSELVMAGCQRLMRIIGGPVSEDPRKSFGEDPKKVK